MNAVERAGLAAPPAHEVAPGAPPAVGAGFAERMRSALAAANRELSAAEQAAAGFAKGEIGDLDAVIALGKADLTLRHLVALRNRALESFQELMRLPL